MKEKEKELYIITDSADNSVTLSKELLRHIKKHSDSSCVYMFVFWACDHYGFRPVDETFAKVTQCGRLQWNERCQSIGFECLVPSVNAMYYRMDIPLGEHRLMVSCATLPDKGKYYKIHQP